MSVAEIGQLHNRYVQLSDRFKAVWTYNQFASGVYKNLLHRETGIHLDFQKLYDDIRHCYDVIQSAASAEAGPMMDRCDRRLQEAIGQLIALDDHISPSIVRRFFEGLRKQDDKILFNLVKFYLYADAIDGDQRDKLDFLFTRIAEDFVEERGEYSAKDTLELRRQFQGLAAIHPPRVVQQDELIECIRSIRNLREEIQNASAFEHLTQENLLSRAREIKESLGDVMLVPDILLALVELNITTKNKFLRLYHAEEQRILEDSRRLLEHEDAIARGFGSANPDLLSEMQHFKAVKQEFDDSRARHNVKHSVITELKISMNNILAQLDRGLDTSAEIEPVSEDFLREVQQAEAVQRVFGDDALLQPYLLRMIAALDALDREINPEAAEQAPKVKPLRLEPWEIASFQKLFWNARRTEAETDELLSLYLRAAALRMRIDEEARALADAPPAQTDTKLLERVKASLERAKELDSSFKEFLQEGVSLSQGRDLHRLYRSRLRLLRGFSGLWLIYDQRASGAAR